MASVGIFTVDSHNNVGDFLGVLNGKAAKIIGDVVSEGHGEPVFVLRGKDLFAILNITNYQELIEKFSPNDVEIGEQISDVIEAFKNWQRGNMDKVRYPD